MDAQRPQDPLPAVQDRYRHGDDTGLKLAFFDGIAEPADLGEIGVDAYQLVRGAGGYPGERRHLRQYALQLAADESLEALARRGSLERHPGALQRRGLEDDVALQALGDHHYRG